MPTTGTAVDAGAKLGFQIGIDTAGNILKEFSRIWSKSSIAAKDEIHGDQRRDLRS